MYIPSSLLDLSIAYYLYRTRLLGLSGSLHFTSLHASTREFEYVRFHTCLCLFACRLASHLVAIAASIYVHLQNPQADQESRDMNTSFCNLLNRGKKMQLK